QVGLSTLAVLDGLRTMEVALTEHPALILLDIKMPTVDGRDVLHWLKQDERTAGIPVFIHSSRNSYEDRMVAFELGADDYFDKSYDHTLLFRRVVHTLEKASSGSYAVRHGSVGKMKAHRG